MEDLKDIDEIFNQLCLFFYFLWIFGSNGGGFWLAITLRSRVTNNFEIAEWLSKIAC